MAMTRTVVDRPGSSASFASSRPGNGVMNYGTLTSTNLAYSSSYVAADWKHSTDEVSSSSELKNPITQSPLKSSTHELESSSQRIQSHCSFCLVSEFDIDKGSTLSHQYPEPIEYDDHLLAELMLPDGVHARSEDWTVFFLPADAIKESVNLSKSTEENSEENLKGKKRHRNSLYYVLNLVRTKHDTSVRRGALVKAIAVGSRHPFIQIFKPALLLALDDYFKSPSPDILARLHESLNALDLSCMPQFSRDEKLILRASERRDLFEERFKERQSLRASSELRQSTADGEDYGQALDSSRSRSESTSTNQSSIADEAVKAASSSVVGSAIAGRSTPQLLQRPSLASLKPGGSSTGILKRRPSASSNQLHSQQVSGMEGSHISLPSVSGHKSNQGMDASSRSSMRDTHYWETSVTYGKIQELPLRIPTDTLAEEIGEYSLIDLMTTFASSTPIGPLHAHLHSNGQQTPAVILLFNAIVSAKRIVFLGHNQPASRVAQHVLSACALGSGCGVAWRGIVKRCFPYANLGTIDELEKIPGYIAGVTNPRFEDLPVWDLLFNIENGKVTVSKDINVPLPFSSGHPRPTMSQSQSSGSMGSSNGNEAEADEGKVSRAVTDTDAVSNGISSLGMSAGGTIKGRDRSGNVLESRPDSADILFMEELTLAIAARYGERYIRSRWTDWASNFLRQVARHEEHFDGEGKSHSQPFLNGQLGSGLITGSKEVEMKEIQSCALRIEAFKATDAYQLYKQDEIEREQNRSITGFDLSHQLARLRRARNMSIRESELIYATISRAIQSREQIIELLAQSPIHQGGLSSISNGLFHPSSAARIAIHDLLLRLTVNPVGKKFVQSLNLFHRLAFARVLHEANESQNGIFTINSPNQPSQQSATMSTTPNSATLCKHSMADSLRNGTQSTLTAAPPWSCEGLPFTDALSSSLSTCARPASPAYLL